MTEVEDRTRGRHIRFRAGGAGGRGPGQIGEAGLRSPLRDQEARFWNDMSIESLDSRCKYTHVNWSGPAFGSALIKSRSQYPYMEI